MKPVIQALLFILGFGSILFLAFITTRLIAGKSIKASRGKYIDIIESVSLGVDKRIHLIKVDKQFLLIASSGKSIEFLTNIILSEYQEQEESKPGSNVFDFKFIFDKYLHNMKGKKEEKPKAGAVDNRVEDSSPAPDSFRSNLNKLRNITRKADNQNVEDGDDLIDEK